MILLVTGGRYFVAQPIDELAFAVLLDCYRPDAVMHGAARGADVWAGAFAAARGFRILERPAKWGLYGAAAGPRRNAEMIVEVLQLGGGRVAAFRGGAGTADCVRRAGRAGLTVVDLRGVR